MNLFRSIRRRRRARRLIAEGLAEIEQKYGANSANPLLYHNVEHARDVMTAVRAIARRAGDKIGTGDRLLLELAACYHDIAHEPGRDDNEASSTTTLQQKMRAASVFTEGEIDRVGMLIDSTKVSFEGGFSQNVNEDYASRVVADADLASLGQPFEVFWDRSCKLWIEQHGRAEITREQRRQFAADQIKFLEKHNYHTPEADALFAHKAANIAELRKFL